MRHYGLYYAFISRRKPALELPCHRAAIARDNIFVLDRC